MTSSNFWTEHDSPREDFVEDPYDEANFNVTLKGNKVGITVYFDHEDKNWRWTSHGEFEVGAGFCDGCTEVDDFEKAIAMTKAELATEYYA
jgi:hypothetical protein